jgi:small subunit ribosomal protein S1
VTEDQANDTQPRSISALKPKMRLRGVVKQTQIYGALVDIGLEKPGLVHISQLAPRRVNRVADVVQEGDEVQVWVTEVDADRGRIGLTMVEPPKVAWSELREGQSYTGTVVRIEAYGAFVDIGAARPGLMHVREMSSGYVRHPSELVKMGDEIDVRILSVDRRKRRIDLTMPDYEEEVSSEDPEEPAKTAMEIALERAQGDEEKPRVHRSKGAPVDLSERAAILSQTLEQHLDR